MRIFRCHRFALAIQLRRRRLGDVAERVAVDEGADVDVGEVLLGADVVAGVVEVPPLPLAHEALHCKKPCVETLRKVV